MAHNNSLFRNKALASFTTVFLSVLGLVFLYYLKYKNQNLSIDNFKLFQLGNLLNLLFTLLIIIGVIFNYLKVKSSLSPIFLIFFSSILIISLILAWFSKSINVSSSNSYIFGHPLDKVIVGAMFTIYQVLQFIFLSALWLSVIGVKNLLILRSLANSLMIVGLLIGFALIYMQVIKAERKAYTGPKSKKNIAVVLGAAVWSNNQPSPSLVARIEQAVNLYDKSYVGKIQLTGSNAPGELSEAQVAANYLDKTGFDMSKVALEKNTTSTIEQIQFINSNILGRKDIARVIIVSDSYHLTRVREISKFYNIKTYVSASHLKMNYSDLISYNLRESIGLLVFWFFAL